MNPFLSLYKKYLSRSALPYWCVLVLDCSIVFISGLVTYYIEHGAASLMQHFWSVAQGLIGSLAVFIIFFIAFHTNRGIIRHSSFIDLRQIAYANALSCAIVYLLHLLLDHLGDTTFIIFPHFKSIVFIFVFSTSVMWGVRVLVKVLYDDLRMNSGAQNIFIYGCMKGGIALAKGILDENPQKYHLEGFISGDHSLDGSRILGARVYFDDDSLLDVMKEKKVTTLLVSPTQIDRFRERTTLIDALINAGIKILIIPRVENLENTTYLSPQLLREVEISDLLPRQKIEVNTDIISSMLRGKRILITGAAGSIGSELTHQIASFQPEELILIDHAETPMHDLRLHMADKHKDVSCFTIVSSITDRDHMEKIFSEHKPEYVFHAAAYKHVPMMEDNPGQAVRNNVYGTRVIADLAVKYGTKKFVMISSDKAVNPTNIMGCSKRICEIYCQSLNSHQDTTQFVTTRFGNVLGSNGSVIPIFSEQIKNGGPVTVTHPDIIRYFMLISEACLLVLEAGTIGKGGEIFVFDMGQPVKIVDLARRMIALSGAKDIKIEFSGLRDGEKLYEELLATKECTKPTANAKIMIAQVREYPYELILQKENELLELSNGFDDKAIARKMKEIVPEFNSLNSRYQQD